jgi:glycosyltransferase involved in cell wall biosynthesis
MDIVVCGAQVPFVRGGAELHMDNLVTALTTAGHRAELVRLPVAWEKGRLFDSPLAWRMLPIDADLVIATNFPSYYVRHPRKVVWLFHQHRGAYDAADAGWSDIGTDPSSLETQRQLVEWDNRVLDEAAHVFTTSGVVADRLTRYNGLSGTPLHHPPPLYEQLRQAAERGSFGTAEGSYVFCPTRLEANKRPELAVSSLASVRPSVRSVVAGRGSLAGPLQETARSLGLEQRVSLPGFVPDDELVELYANALAVIYAPFDEDYGYVTLQAFYAGKPVITAGDSGGTLEWVVDGETGFVTDGTPAGVGAAIEKLAADPELARRMGEAGREKVRGLGWQPVVDRLLGAVR